MAPALIGGVVGAAAVVSWATVFHWLRKNC